MFYMKKTINKIIVTVEEVLAKTLSYREGVLLIQSLFFDRQQIFIDVGNSK